MGRLVTICLVVGLSFGLARITLAQHRPVLVNVDKVIIEPMTQTVPVLGRIVPLQKGIVAALTRGPVSNILVNIGDRVSKDDVLVQLVTATLLAERDLRVAELNEKEAELVTARIQLGLSRRELVRVEGLKKSAAFSKARFDDKLGQVNKYVSEVAEANAAIARARANLRLINIELNNTTIRAPYSGVVVELHTTEGAYLNAGGAVITLTNDRDLEIEANISSIRMKGIKVGRTIAVDLEDGSRQNARVRAVVPSENVRTRTRPVRFVPLFENWVIAKLVSNQSLTLHIPIDEDRDVITVDKDAIVLRSDGAIVFVATGGRASLRRVRLGRAIKNRFEVLEGLAVGEIVVVRGNERLLPGQTLRWPQMSKPKSNLQVEAESSG